MLFLHEVHQVVGTRADDFEAAIRDGWMRELARGDDARLLYFLHHAVGTGVSYNVVTITAVRDGAAWERLARRVESGDLAKWAARVDDLRHEVFGKVLVPLPWSPLQDVDLASVPTEPAEHELTVFMEDTVWPYEGRFEEYLERSGSHYAKEIESEGRLLTVDGGFRTALGSHRRREVVLWQKITDTRMLQGLITTEIPPQYKKPGTWMHDALEWRDQWESKLLRTSPWSPWY